MATEASFTREPAAWLEVAKLGLAAVAVLAIPDLDADMQAAILAVIYAVVGAAQAVKTRPIAPAAFVALFTTAAALFGRFGLELGPEQIAAVVGLISGVAALQTRAQVSPALPGA